MRIWQDWRANWLENGLIFSLPHRQLMIPPTIVTVENSLFDWSMSLDLFDHYLAQLTLEVAEQAEYAQ